MNSKKPPFSQLVIAGTFGGLSAIGISSLVIFTIFNGQAVPSSPKFSQPEIYQRGSGRDWERQQIATENDEKAPPPRKRRQKTKIATDSSDAQTETTD